MISTWLLTIILFSLAIYLKISASSTIVRSLKDRKRLVTSWFKATERLWPACKQFKVNTKAFANSSARWRLKTAKLRNKSNSWWPRKKRTKSFKFGLVTNWKNLERKFMIIAPGLIFKSKTYRQRILQLRTKLILKWQISKITSIKHSKTMKYFSYQKYKRILRTLKQPKKILLN